ncbi:hypothetical protein BDP27DRAFT_1435641 [Rhodocollybia butyracea]|uniref:Uncharacterized protein n=1 Tax=Rhodocollybia butyracea TaxID=206335 RepID=A0A9P5P7K4_9AGAR|nr:hypothetical protein BDP27DRAFT_1435641 [Rhodocollybia butyracea]
MNPAVEPRFSTQTSLCLHCGETYLRHVVAQPLLPPLPAQPLAANTQPPVPISQPATAIPWSGHRLAGINRQDHQEARDVAQAHVRTRGIAASPIAPFSAPTPPSSWATSSTFDTAPPSSRISRGSNGIIKKSSPGKIRINFRIVINCAPSNDVFCDMEVPDTQPCKIRAPSASKQARMILRATELQLTFVLKGDVARLAKPYDVIHERLLQHFAATGLTFMGRDGVPINSIVAGTHPWTFFMCNASNRASGQPLLHMSRTPWDETYDKLVKSAARYSALVAEGETEQLIFLAPITSIIGGFLASQQIRVHRHFCLNSRLWIGFYTPNEAELAAAVDEFATLCWYQSEGDDSADHVPGNCPAEVEALSSGPVGSFTLPAPLAPPALPIHLPRLSCTRFVYPDISMLLEALKAEATNDTSFEVSPEIRSAFSNVLLANVPDSFTVTGEDRNCIAQSLWDGLTKVANGETDFLSALSNFSLQSLHTDIRLSNVRLGEDGASGRGVWRDVIYTMEKGLIHSEDWQAVGDDGHFSILLRPFDVIPYPDSTLSRFRAIGLFIRLCLIWQIEPLQISPILISYLISQSLDVSTDSELLQHVSPQTQSRLSAWPPAHIDSVLSPVFHLITQATDGVYPLDTLRRCTPEQFQAMEPLVRRAIAFNCTPALITPAHPLIAALLDGLNLPSTGRRVSCWTQVLPLFNVDSFVSAGDEYLDRERGFAASMFRYLAKSAENCQKFLHAVTGSPYIPLADHGGNAMLKIEFTIRLAVAISFHTCFLSFDVLHSDGTSEYFLGQVPDDLSVVTPFDVWFGALVADGEFNSV